MQNSLSSFRLSSSPTSPDDTSPAQEAQDCPIQAASAFTSTATADPAAGMSGRQRGPVAMPSMQSKLLQQFRERTSTLFHGQESVQHPAIATFNEQVTQRNKEVIAAFLQKTNADPNNTQLTKDYWRDVLVEVADWLKQQTHYPHIRSLADLQHFSRSWSRSDMIGRDYFKLVQELESHFTASGAAPMWILERDNKNYFKTFLYALHDFFHTSEITLPPSRFSREEERILHAYMTAGEQQGKDQRTVLSEVACIGLFCQWLHQRKACQKPIPYELDALEKLRDHPKNKEDEVRRVIEHFRNDPDAVSIIKEAISACIDNLRQWKPLAQAPAAPAALDLNPPTMLQQQPPVQRDQAAGLSPPHSPNLSEYSFTFSDPVEFDPVSNAPDIQNAAASAGGHVFAASTSGTQPHSLDWLEDSITSADIDYLYQVLDEPDMQDDAASAAEHVFAAATSGTQPHEVRQSASELQDQLRAVLPWQDMDLNFSPSETEEFAASTSGAQPRGVRRAAPSLQEETRAVRPRRDNNPDSL